MQFKKSEYYDKEVKRFKSEDEYKLWILINTCKLRMESEDLIKKLNKLYETITEGRNIAYNKLIYSQYEKDKTYLKIYTDTPYFDGLKYLCEGAYKLPETISEYVYKNTQSEYLTNEFTDVDKYLNNKELLNILNNNALKISYSIFSILCPMYMNSKHLVSIDNNSITFRVPSNISILLIDDIHQQLKYFKYLNLYNYELKLFRVTNIINNDNIEIIEIPYNYHYIEQVTV